MLYPPLICVGRLFRPLCYSVLSTLCALSILCRCAGRDVTAAIGRGRTYYAAALFSCRTNRRGVLVLEHIHCGEHTALLMRDLGNIERHLDTGESAHQHQIVEMTEMADAEDPALELRQARAERHVEVLQDHVAEMVGVMAS